LPAPSSGARFAGAESVARLLEPKCHQNPGKRLGPAAKAVRERGGREKAALASEGVRGSKQALDCVDSHQESAEGFVAAGRVTLRICAAAASQ